MHRVNINNRDVRILTFWVCAQIHGFWFKIRIRKRQPHQQQCHCVSMQSRIRSPSASAVFTTVWTLFRPTSLCRPGLPTYSYIMCLYNSWKILHIHKWQKSRAVVRKPSDAAAVDFGLKFADNIYCKFKSSQASKARLQSSKLRTDAKQNLTQNGHSRSFKVTCFGVSGKAIRD